MIFTIYANRLEEVSKKLEKLQNKAKKYGKKLNFSVGEEHPATIAIRDIDHITQTIYTKETCVVAAVDVEVDFDTLICLDNWRVVAQIDHGDNGNVVNLINSQEQINAIWYDLKPFCEHCNTNRRRNITFIVKHENGIYKQVGKSCLMDYTGISPALVAMAAEIKDICIDSSGEKECYNFDINNIKMFSIHDILAASVESIEKYGYIKADYPNSTKLNVLEMLHKQTETSEKSKKEAENIINWLKNLDVNIGIERDCKSLICGEYAKIKHIGKLAYMPISYKKALEQKQKEIEQSARKEAEKTSVYVGTVGEKVTFTAEKAALLTSYPTEYGYAYVYKFISNGNIFVWFSSRSVEGIQDGCTIKGTVKSHSERDGVKQSILTRCKVI